MTLSPEACCKFLRDEHPELSLAVDLLESTALYVKCKQVQEGVQKDLNMSGMQACRSIVRGEVDYGKKCWSKVSPLAREFVASLLRKEPASRPSAAQVQPHVTLSNKPCMIL